MDCGSSIARLISCQMVNDVLESLHEWATDRGLDIGADSNLPLWDGTRPDYDWAVGALLRAG